MHRYLRRRRIVTPTGRAAPLGAESADKRKNGTNDVKRFALERRRPFMLSRRVKECIGNLLAAFASEKTIRGNRGQIYYRKPPPLFRDYIFPLRITCVTHATTLATSADDQTLSNPLKPETVSLNTFNNTLSHPPCLCRSNFIRTRYS